jgi:hypothetical protein
LAELGGVGFGGQAGAGLQQEHGHKGPKAGELGHGLGRTWQWQATYFQVLTQDHDDEFNAFEFLRYFDLGSLQSSNTFFWRHT